MAAPAIPVAYYVLLLAALTVIVIWQQTFGTPEKAAEAARNLQRVLDEIANLFKGQPLPEDLERAKQEAEEALEKARKPKPDPKPYPPPIPPPNLGPDKYDRDRNREECERKQRKYRWGPHSEVQGQIGAVYGVREQSHHVVQHAHLSTDRSPGNGLASICPDYNINNAPALPVVGGDTVRGSPHFEITRSQQEISRQYAQRFIGPPPGPRPTYGEALAEGMGQVAARTPMGSDPVALACLTEYVMEYFQRTCPGMNASTQLRIPYMRPTDPGP
jgi:hypothetical protein